MINKEVINSFFRKCRRVWLIMKKPDLEEFKLVSKISLIGLLLIGLIGFLISVIVHYMTAGF
jgi:protein transport protein SEC61 subunit gamma and related proteins